MERKEFLIKDLPDPESARRFLGQLAEAHATHHAKLLKNESLQSDVLTLVSFSPLLATTLLQNPDYIGWLDRKRLDSGVRGKEELLESLARFSLTNSQLEPQVLFARFRRRELLRIYLRDIRGLATIAEITEEISHLADAILEAALKTARREMDNRFGSPQETDEKGRAASARFCIAALGKLGSRELNYSSDIDLLFLYSDEGTTSGSGTRGAVTNREYFIKLAEYTAKLVASSSGEGAAYRVDLRLRPHGTLGALALSVKDLIRYHKVEARPWERQVLIRSRGCAGDIDLFREFFLQVEDLVFSTTETVASSLRNVRLSKQKIDLEMINRRGYDVKLGRGGIREIEFIAQALQLAHGGQDKWLRSPHTLISLDRLADRRLLTEAELTGLAAAYEFLRRTEHVLQMENGVQTHTVSDDTEKREVLARRIEFIDDGDFEQNLKKHTDCVAGVFTRVFGVSPLSGQHEEEPTELGTPNAEIPDLQKRTLSHVMASIEKSDVAYAADETSVAVLTRITAVSPHFSAMLAANPDLAASLPDPEAEFAEPDYAVEMMDAVESTRDFGQRLSAMRKAWSHLLMEIVVRDIFEKITISEAKRLQTKLAEASIAAALRAVRDELAHRYHDESTHLDLAILALGKLGGRGLDYDSDLDLVIVYYDPKEPLTDVTPAEFYSRAVELFVTALSSMTRDGNLYRVDLRLRPFGSKGMSAMSIDAFLGYMQDTAAIWEMLAFVKLRFVGGDLSIGFNVENETRRLIHERAAAADPAELRAETLRVRHALEEQRARSARGKDIDIKYGSGGLLDVYFAMRYLQLRYNIPDSDVEEERETNSRSTLAMLNRLHKLAEKNEVENGTLPVPFSPLPLFSSAIELLTESYTFLAALDHNLRLTVGRTTRVPVANDNALKTIAARMHLASPADLLEHLTIHRLNIRSAFDTILADPKA